MGKKRAVTIPKNIYEKYGQYTYAYCEKESFLKALLRSKNNDLPEGTVDIYYLQELDSNKLKASPEIH